VIDHSRDISGVVIKRRAWKRESQRIGEETTASKRGGRYDVLAHGITNEFGESE
jgi:hypothetical protein